MSKSAVPMVDIVLLCPFFQAINIHFNSPMDEYRLLWFCLVSTCSAFLISLMLVFSKAIFSD